jgi:prepilin peptidase CpaA
MTGEVADILVAVLAAMLVVAATGDLRSRTIPNWLNLAIALLAIPFWVVSQLPLWPDIALQVAVAAGVFAIFALAFSMGAMGGGDVKLIAAIALWLPPLAVMKLIMVMALAGGAITLAMMIRHRIAKAEQPVEVPYGVAIAFAGFWLIGERFFYHFG